MQMIMKKLQLRVYVYALTIPSFHITICIYLFKFRFDDEHFVFINNLSIFNNIDKLFKK